jgi:3-mercaptopyruvate sulfurtransferase SseA
VARKLIKMGFQQVYVLKGGWNKWVDEQYPTEPK